jgi:hypothetical protein
MNTLTEHPNAFTERLTHGNGRRDPQKQFWESNFGRGENTKNEVLADMLALTT